MTKAAIVLRKTLCALVLSREGKRVEMAPNQVQSFSPEEVAKINKINQYALDYPSDEDVEIWNLRNPVAETTSEGTDTTSEGPAVDTKPKGKGGKGGKPDAAPATGPATGGEGEGNNDDEI